MRPVSSRSLFERAIAVLTAKLVRFKYIPPTARAQVPSGRLTDEIVVFPGSKSQHNHVLFLSALSATSLLIVAYSKVVLCSSELRERLLLQLLTVNESEPNCLMKLEERGTVCFPVLEMQLYVPADESDPERLIWSGLGVIDMLFKKHVEKLALAQPLSQTDMCSQVKSMLSSEGFTRIKETPIPNGQSFLVVLSNDAEEENSPTKRFPLKIDVTGILAFRIYFSMNDAAVTAHEPFRSAVIELLPRVNWMLQMGYYNIASNSNQLQLTFKLHYAKVSSGDIQPALKNYYENIVSCYKATVPCLAQVYLAAQSSNSPIDLIAPLSLIQTDTQEETFYERIQYATSDQQETEVAMCRALLENSDTAAYFLPSPFIFSSSDTLYRKNNRDLISVIKMFESCPHLRVMLCEELARLQDAFRSQNIYPRLEMVHISPDQKLIVLPSPGFHTHLPTLLKECFELFACVETRELSTVGDCCISIEAFSEFAMQKSVGGWEVLTAKMGADDYLLHPLKGTDSDFAVELEVFRSMQSTVQDDCNSIAGWTESNGDMEISELAIGTSNTQWVCERAAHSVCRSFSLHDAYRLILLLENLHANGFVHLFLSYATIRRNRKTQDLILVFPCLEAKFAEFLRTFLCTNYQAPEVTAYLIDRSPIISPQLADVYSLCRVLIEGFEDMRVTDRELLLLLQRGIGADPNSRPSLAEMKVAIEARIKDAKRSSPYLC